MRRFKRWQLTMEIKNVPGTNPDPSFSILPDLLIVDGGKGQLNRAVLVLAEFNLTDKVSVTGLAKEEEELFIPDQELSIRLPRTSQGLYLLQRIRDEAHRFAITAHRNLRSKKGMASQLDSITGIGPAKRTALIKKFGSVEKIRQATVVELTEVKGITEEIAKRIKENLP